MINVCCCDCLRGMLDSIRLANKKHLMSIAGLRKMLGSIMLANKTLKDVYYLHSLKVLLGV
jgi:hypothetical protein